jgi:elongation factor P--(R)-beta-lysine ligase
MDMCRDGHVMNGGWRRDRRISELGAGAGPCWIAGRVVPGAAAPAGLRLRDGSAAIDVVFAARLDSGPPTPIGAWLWAHGRLDEAGRFAADAIEVVGLPTLRAGERAEWSDPAWEAKRRELVARDRLLAALRADLRAHGFLEVETPALLAAPGQEPHLQPFATSYHGRRGATPLWLATSPEYALKRLLAIGFERMFQLGRSWRDGADENAPLHAPEFTLLEWYRAFEGLAAIAADFARLLRAGAAAVGAKELVVRGEKSCDLAQPGEWLTVRDAFRTFAGVDLEPYLDGDDERFVAPLASRWRRGEGDARARADLAYFRILIEAIEPKLGLGRPTFLHAYPARHAALAELDAADRRVAKRFEGYVLGLELCNAFEELRDAAEQERRLRAESEERVRLGGPPLPISDDFLGALRSGLPPCAGVALGVDRLHLLLTGAARVADVIPFPFSDDL